MVEHHGGALEWTTEVGHWGGALEWSTKVEQGLATQVYWSNSSIYFLPCSLELRRLSLEAETLERLARKMGSRILPHRFHLLYCSLPFSCLRLSCKTHCLERLGGEEEATYGLCCAEAQAPCWAAGTRERETKRPLACIAKHCVGIWMSTGVPKAQRPIPS